MTREELALTALPRLATDEDYSHAARELEESLAALPGALAVYRYGSVTVPGISDIDLVAVIEDSRRVPDVWSRLSDRTRDLAMHTPVLVDPRTFELHRWFADLGSLVHVWGEHLEVEPRPLPEYSEPLLATEALVITALKLAKLGITGRVKVRPLLCELKNIRVDLRLARIDRGDAPRAWDLAADVESLRSTWWSLSGPEQVSGVRDVVGRAAGATNEALDVLGTRFNGSAGCQSFRLGGGWRNVTVVAGNRARGQSSVLTTIVARWRRLGEARWRWRAREIHLTPGVISLLVGSPRGDYEDFRAKRDELVRHHVDFLVSCPGYSPIGLAPVFLSPHADGRSVRDS